MNANANANNANASANNDKAAAKAAEKAAKKAARAAKKNEPLTFWAYWLRIAFWTLVFIAAITAIALGMHFGIAYLAALGLGEGLALALHYIVIIVGHIGAMAVGWNIGDIVGNLTVRRMKAKFIEGFSKTAEATDFGAAAAAA
jgi:lipopolysaccharide export LptBFGC system permease protein LptF